MLDYPLEKEKSNSELHLREVVWHCQIVVFRKKKINEQTLKRILICLFSIAFLMKI